MFRCTKQLKEEVRELSLELIDVLNTTLVGGRDALMGDVPGKALLSIRIMYWQKKIHTRGGTIE